jgi:thiosulfate dehydrogenase
MKVFLIALGIVSTVIVAENESLPQHAVPAAKNGGIVIEACDGVTSVEVPGQEGKPLSPKQAQNAADKLMAAWKDNHPDQSWVVADAGTEMITETREIDSKPEKPTNVQEGTYGNYTDRDRLVWKMETEKLVQRGKEIFHSAALLKGRVGISCDMCHPNAANTHPETYPKYQVQLQRVALLRDMINWCIENPVKGKTLKDDDFNMKALEAYIIAQRKGVALEYGKH